MGIGPQLDLRQRLLVTTTTSRARMAHGVAEIHKSSLGQQDNALAVGEFISSTAA